MTSTSSAHPASTGLRFSVVVPAHNVAQHIGATLASLADQSRPFHEVIVVDDGSTDATAEVIATVVSAHPLPGFSVIRQENAGVSVARNVGLEACTGDYVIFLDGDDVVDPDLSSMLVRDATSWTAKPDVIVWKFHDQKFEQLVGGSLEDRWAAGIPPWSTGPETLRRMLVTRTQLVNLLAAAFRTDFLRGRGLAFAQGCRTGEDVEFQHACLAQATAVRFLDQALSTYVWRDGSITNSSSLGLFDGVLAYDRSASYLASHLGDEDLDLVEAARRGVPPRFMDIFVEQSRAHPEGGIALLGEVDRSLPGLVPRVRYRIRQAEAQGVVDRKWTLFRAAPRVAAWYFASSWSQAPDPGLRGRIMSTIRRVRSGAS